MSIKIRCYRATKTNPGETIEEPLIVSQEMAELRGKRYLDDPEQGNYYGVRVHSLKLPYKSGVYPGKFISVTSKKLGLTGKILRVRSARITGTAAQLWLDVEAEEFLS